MDDASDPARVRAAAPRLAARCDLLLGPYSTLLAQAAASALEDGRSLLWNHGGAGDVGARVISVPTPAGRYAEPFLRRVAGPAPLRIVAGRGAFGRAVADGAEALARRLGLDVARSEPGEPPPAGPYDLLSAGVFEADVAVVRRALAQRTPPRAIWSVAAGVRDFGAAVGAPNGVYGPAQWFPGAAPPAELGPDEAAFLAAYGSVPDYPAVQAAAAGVLARHCALASGSVAPDALRAAAAALDASTLFGRFRLDPATGAQVGHETVLVRWGADGPAAVL